MTQTQQQPPAPAPIMVRGETIVLQAITQPDGSSLPVLVIGAAGGLVSMNVGLTSEAVDSLITGLTDARQGMTGGGLVVPTAEQAAQVNGRRR
jgi:hypothetical protein